MEATSATSLPALSRKPRRTGMVLRCAGGAILVLIHGYVIFEIGKFMFLEYVARFGDKYVWITPHPHAFLQLFVLIGLVGLTAATVPLASRKRSAKWLLLSFALVICEVDLPVTISVQNDMYLYRVVDGVGAGERLLENFYTQNKRYPASQQELGAFVPGQEAFVRWSSYAHRGARMPYRFVYISNASGPHIPDPPGPDPATVYCAVSGDLKHFWTTATGLRGPIGSEVVMARGWDDGHIIVFDENVSKPAPRKKR